jgi:regulator of sigma E protease
MNLIAGFLIVVFVNSFMFMPVPQVDSLRTGSSLAEEGGLRAGDTILQMDGYAIEHTSDFDKVLSADENDKQFDVLVVRDGKELLLRNVTFEPREFPENEEGQAGIFYGITWQTRKLSFGEVIAHSWNDCLSFAEMVWMSLGMLLSGEASVKDMSGPVGIVYATNQAAKSGVLYVIYLAALLSLNLAIINMLPFPALDGGRLLFLVIRLFTGKRVSDETEGKIHFIGICLLFALMIYVTFNDVIKFIIPIF